MTRSTRPSTRLFVDAPLHNTQLRLQDDRAHYLGRVLRCRVGDRIVVFNARGDERLAAIDSLARRHAELTLCEELDVLPESPIRLILLQAIIKSDAMDLIVQKATELGAHTVVAVKTEYSVVRFDADRQQRRLEHWRRIAISACEQCGRHRPPEFEVCGSIDDAAARLPPETSRIALHTAPGERPGDPLDQDDATGSTIALAVGPEGGFSSADVARLSAAGFVLRAMGPRVLRAETAAIAACASAQLLWGDLGAEREPV
jgi:16S rRNA (uracil1498-N3)-methyltransferase